MCSVPTACASCRLHVLRADCMCFVPTACASCRLHVLRADYMCFAPTAWAPYQLHVLYADCMCFLLTARAPCRLQGLRAAWVSSTSFFSSSSRNSSNSHPNICVYRVSLKHFLSGGPAHWVSRCLLPCHCVTEARLIVCPNVLGGPTHCVSERVRRPGSLCVRTC